MCFCMFWVLILIQVQISVKIYVHRSVLLFYFAMCQSDTGMHCKRIKQGPVNWSWSHLEKFDAKYIEYIELPSEQKIDNLYHLQIPRNVRQIMQFMWKPPVLIIKILHACRSCCYILHHLWKTVGYPQKMLEN